MCVMVIFGMKTYEDILDSLLRSIEKRDGREPTLVAANHKFATQEGMCREGICQVLAAEPRWIRWKTLLRYPQLILPYLIRIRRTKKE